MCSNNIQYFANNGNISISTANPNLDGTGVLGTVITAGLDGTIVKTVTIKATGNTTQGMVRLFIDNGSGSIFLLQEIMIPGNDQTGVVPAFSFVLSNSFTLSPTYILKASTENPEGFSIIATATNWQNCPCPTE